MDLDLDLTPRTRGRAARPPEVEFVRELEPADLTLLEVERGIKPPALQELKDSHHALARSLATGMKPYEASLVTGYSPSRISILQADPAFKELVEFYRQNEEAIYASLHERMALLGLETASELQRRLREEPGEISSNLLNEMLKTLADRTGHGPQTKSTHVNVNVDLSARLQAGRERLKALQAPPAQPEVIDHAD